MLQVFIQASTSNSTQTQQQKLHSSCFHLSKKHLAGNSVSNFKTKTLSFLSDKHLFYLKSKYQIGSAAPEESVPDKINLFLLPWTTHAPHLSCRYPSQFLSGLLISTNSKTRNAYQHGALLSAWASHGISEQVTIICLVTN